MAVVGLQNLRLILSGHSGIGSVAVSLLRTAGDRPGDAGMADSIGWSGAELRGI